MPDLGSVIYHQKLKHVFTAETEPRASLDEYVDVEAVIDDA